MTSSQTSRLLGVHHATLHFWSQWYGIRPFRREQGQGRTAELVYTPGQVSKLREVQRLEREGKRVEEVLAELSMMVRVDESEAA